MEVEVTKLFIREARRNRNRVTVANALRRLRDQAETGHEWFKKVERLNTSAVDRCFRFKVLSGDRLIAAYQPPLRLLDVGLHDEALDRWNRGKTDPSIQTQRFEDVVETPLWVTEIFSKGNRKDG